MEPKRWLTCIALLLLAVAPAGAQGEGRIEGRVTRPDGGPLGGVAVVINETSAVAITDNSGNFAFSGVPAGAYSLTFNLGDNVDTQSAVVVEAGSTTRLDKSVDWQVSFAESITVTSASRRPERIVEAPAAVTVVTAEEIEQEAVHGQLPKLLEFTPGAEVTQSGVYDYNFNTRGFNSSLNRRVATLIDGRDPSVPFLGAQEWAAISFPLDDLAGLELLRGPSAALYGANASSGVLNLVTKAPRYSQGGLVRVTGGELSTGNLDFRWAGELGGDWYFKALGGLRTSGDFTVSRVGFAEYAVPCSAAAGVATDCLPQEVVPLNPEDDDEISFGGLRFDKYLGNGHALTLEGGTASVEGPVFQTGIGRVQLVEVDRPWARFNYHADRWNLLLDYSARDAPRQTALASGTNLTLDTERMHAELQGNWDLAGGKGRIVVGGSYREEDIDSFDPRVGRQTLLFEPLDADFEAVFAQLDWDLTDELKLVLAGRFDDSTLHDSQFSPKGSLVYSFNPSHSLRFTYNEAFQVANYSEFFLQANAAPPADLSILNLLVCFPFGLDCGLGVTPVLALGNKDLEIEEVKSFELGYSGILGGKAFLTVDYYNSENENFITDLLPQLGTALGRVNDDFGPWEAPPGIPDAIEDTIRGLVPLLSNNVDGSNILAAASYTNFGAVDTQGVDVGLNYYLDPRWTVSFSYSWFDFDLKEELPGFENLLLPNSPENKASFGLGYSNPTWDWQVNGRWVDDFRWAVGPFQGDVESYTTVDLVGNYSFSDHWRVGVNVSNLFDEEHWESFGGDLLGRRALGHIEYSW